MTSKNSVETTRRASAVSATADAHARSDALALGLIEEARVAEASGHRELARRRYESALYLLRGENQSGQAATILRSVGLLYFEDGEFAAGMDCAEAALAVAEATGDRSAVARAKNVLAVGHWRRGQLADADRLYREAEQEAREIGDVKLAAMVEQNLGIIATARGDLDAALHHYHASLSGYQDLGLDDFIGKLLANMGMVYTKLERWEEAERIFQEALAICAACGDVSTALMVEGNRAEAQIARGLFKEAQLVCERVLRRARGLKDTRAVAEAQKHLGVIAREQERHAEAEQLLVQAFEGANAREDLLLAAEVAREQAELYTSLKRDRETLQALNTSHRLFSQLRAQRDLADIGRRMRRLEKRFEDIVSRWARSIEAKDPYTLGHCERVADYACAIARDLGFDDATLFWFRIGAILHDVGKIEVPIEVLNKPGKLTPEERAIVERHPEAGVELLQDVEFPWDVIPMVRSHHERWDGTGYPDRLAGEAIPLNARILCVADVFDALTTDRPYRAGFSREKTFEIMGQDSGKAFDAEILARFRRLIAERPELHERRSAASNYGSSAPRHKDPIAA